MWLIRFEQLVNYFIKNKTLPTDILSITYELLQLARKEYSTRQDINQHVHALTSSKNQLCPNPELLCPILMIFDDN